MEGGKTLDDALAEVREAVDLCRYYAAEARRTLLPKAFRRVPTGEANELRYRGVAFSSASARGIFRSRYLLGQVGAALVAGNSVVAKPAEQTPLIAAQAVRILYEAGIPASALHLVPGDGKIGAALVANSHVAGIAFTGSTEVARSIHRTLAAKDAAIGPLMSDRRHQRHDRGRDRIARAGRRRRHTVLFSVRPASAARRCALLCVQEDVADRLVEMIAGAADELKVGDPRDPATHIGPVDRCGGQEQSGPVDRDDGRATAGAVPLDASRTLPAVRTLPRPIVILDRAGDLQQEVFGPILGVVRWRANELDPLLDEIAANGYGLTLGIHTRIDSAVEHVVARLANGNVYVNRNMIGAVVGTQPFGGTGLSGTGPKAGGPNYLRRFATEQVITINTAATGGNASLLTATDD